MAGDTFAAIHRIAELKRDTRALCDDIAVLLVPTTPTIYTKEEIAANPIQLNINLGIYTNFVNLMGLCGIAVPNGFRKDGLRRRPPGTAGPTAPRPPCSASGRIRNSFRLGNRRPALLPLYIQKPLAVLKMSALRRSTRQRYLPGPLPWPTGSRPGRAEPTAAVPPACRPLQYRKGATPRTNRGNCRSRYCAAF